MIQIHKGDLFDLSFGKPKVHCVSADFAMGKGIAQKFRTQYGRPSPDEEVPVGACYPQAFSEGGNDSFIFHLVTKSKYYHKPTRGSITEALDNLRSLAEARDIKELWMPKIGTGLDRLDWDSQVYPAIINAFNDFTGEIHVVELP